MTKYFSRFPGEFLIGLSHHLSVRSPAQSFLNRQSGHLKRRLAPSPATFLEVLTPTELAVLSAFVMAYELSKGGGVGFSPKTVCNQPSSLQENWGSVLICRIALIRLVRWETLWRTTALF